MKTIKTIMCILLLSVTLSSCTSNGGDELISGEDFFTAKVDGADWAAITGSSDTIAWTIPHQGIVTIQGSDSNGTAITMNIWNYNGVGTYDFSTGGFIQYVVGATQPNSGAWACTTTSGTNGSVEITSDDGTIIEGTLSFVGKNASDNSTKTITLGEFRATKE